MLIPLGEMPGQLSEAWGVGSLTSGCWGNEPALLPRKHGCTREDSIVSLNQSDSRPQIFVGHKLSRQFGRIEACDGRRCGTGHVRYINILTWLRGFQVKPLYLVLFSLYLSLFWELRDKGKPRSHARILIYRTWPIDKWHTRERQRQSKVYKFTTRNT